MFIESNKNMKSEVFVIRFVNSFLICILTQQKILRTDILLSFF